MALLNNIYDASICVGEVPGDRYEGTACSRMETGIFPGYKFSTKTFFKKTIKIKQFSK